MIEKIISFVVEHYREIIDISVLIISVLICLIRKRPVVNEIDKIKSYILEILPVLIDSVERPGCGSSKKETVLKTVRSIVKKKFHFELTDSMLDFVGEKIEAILTAPTKKGE